MIASRISRRHSLTKAMQLAAAVGLSWATAGMASAQSKIAQKTAGYQDKPSDQNRCGTCAHFAPPNACKIVDGQVSPSGWCKLFVAKME